jgi:hypothetical protein
MLSSQSPTGKAARSYIARRLLRIARRRKLRAASEAKHYEAWLARRATADRLITVGIAVRVCSAARSTAAAVDAAVAVLARLTAADKRTDRPLYEEPASSCELWAGFELEVWVAPSDNSTESSADRSANSSANLLAARSGWTPATVLKAGPYEEVSAEGLKRYAKGCYAVQLLNSSGTVLSGVLRSQLRVLALRVGDVVEAHWQRGAEVYPGVITAVENRCKYTVTYAGGQSEVGVLRGDIRLEASAVALREAAAVERAERRTAAAALAAATAAAANAASDTVPAVRVAVSIQHTREGTRYGWNVSSSSSTKVYVSASLIEVLVSYIMYY